MPARRLPALSFSVLAAGIVLGGSTAGSAAEGATAQVPPRAPVVLPFSEPAPDPAVRRGPAGDLLPARTVPFEGVLSR